MTKYHPILNFILNIFYLNQKIAKTISTKEHILINQAQVTHIMIVFIQYYIKT